MSRCSEPTVAPSPLPATTSACARPSSPAQPSWPWAHFPPSGSQGTPPARSQHHPHPVHRPRRGQPRDARSPGLTQSLVCSAKVPSPAGLPPPAAIGPRYGRPAVEVGQVWGRPRDRTWPGAALAGISQSVGSAAGRQSGRPRRWVLAANTDPANAMPSVKVESNRCVRTLDQRAGP